MESLEDILILRVAPSAANLTCEVRSENESSNGKEAVIQQNVACRVCLALFVSLVSLLRADGVPPAEQWIGLAKSEFVEAGRAASKTHIAECAYTGVASSLASLPARSGATRASVSPAVRAHRRVGEHPNFLRPDDRGFRRRRCDHICISYVSPVYARPRS